MHVTAQLIISNGRPIQCEEFTADLRIEGGIATFSSIARKLSRPIARARVALLEVHELHWRVGGLTIAKHDTANPAERGKQTVYCEWIVRPAWNTDYSRESLYQGELRRRSQT